MWKEKLVLINSFQIVNLKFCTISPVIGKNAGIKVFEYCVNSARFFSIVWGYIDGRVGTSYLFFSTDVKTFCQFTMLNCKLICDVLLKKPVYYNIPPCEERIIV